MVHCESMALLGNGRERRRWVCRVTDLMGQHRVNGNDPLRAP